MINIENLKPFPKFCCSIGMIPTSYKISLTYEEQLLWLCDFLENTVIPTVNNNGQAVEELQNLFVTLTNYVDNYFDNLDVQTEINNKLDDMVENGELDIILSNLIFTDYIIPESFGAKGDGITDDYSSILSCINYANENHKNIKFSNTYLLKKPANITKDDYLFVVNCSFFGSGKIKIDDNFGEYKSIFRINNVDNLFFRDITIDQNSYYNVMESLDNTGYKSVFSFGTGKNLLIDNIKFLNTCGTWVIEGGGVNYVDVNNCKNLNAGFGQILSYDTSNFYFLGDYINITNNLFEGLTAGVRTAIEIESNYKNVSGNIIKGFPTGIIIASSSSEDDAGKSNITNNLIKNCQYGIILWATHKIIKNVIISNNQIFPNSLINGNSYSQVVGVYFYYPSTYSFDNININNNLIEFLSSNVNATDHSNGIDVSVYYSDTSNYIRNLNINNNTIKNPHTAGICLNTRGEMSNINIQGNIIQDWNNGNSNITNYKNGITIGSDMYIVENMKINNNILRYTGNITNYAMVIASRNEINNKIDINNNFFDTAYNLISISNTVGKVYFNIMAKVFNKILNNADINSCVNVGDIKYIYNGSNWYKETSSSTVPDYTAENEGDTVLNTGLGRGVPYSYKNISGTWYPILQMGYRRQTLTGAPTFNCAYVGELVFNLVDLTWYIGIAVGESGASGWKLITN